MWAMDKNVIFKDIKAMRRKALRLMKIKKKISTFADDTVILAVGSVVHEATSKLQLARNIFCEWENNSKIKLNELKSTYITSQKRT